MFVKVLIEPPLHPPVSLTAKLSRQQIEVTNADTTEGKKIKGRKRHISVDVLGLLICVIVHSAATSDRSGAKLLIAKAVDICPTLKLFWADGGYSGKPLYDWVKLTFQRVLEIIKRPTGEFKIVQWRWIVERTFGWFNRYRRLSKDYEIKPENSETWIKLAMINIMIHRLEPG